MAARNTNNDIEIRAGSSRRITFTLKVNNVAFNLTSSSEVILYMKKVGTTSVVSISTDDAGILSYDADKTTGKVHLDPLATTFDAQQNWTGYFMVVISGKSYAFAENDEFNIKVRA